jgi:hypothetical protein
MNLKSLQHKAKQMLDKRGGTDSLKADAAELKDIAKGPGSFSEKAKRAGDALKEPGANAPDTPEHTAEPAPAPAPGHTPDTASPDRPPVA